ncbi:MAG: hypothetical protein RJR25_03585 [Acetomicrobium sp.]|nr:hypothetical protein [Acetomicrobium sp.]
MSVGSLDRVGRFAEWLSFSTGGFSFASFLISRGRLCCGLDLCLSGPGDYADLGSLVASPSGLSLRPGRRSSASVPLSRASEWSGNPPGACGGLLRPRAFGRRAGALGALMPGLALPRF